MIVFVILWNELEVKGTTDSQNSASSRDLDLEIDNGGILKTKLYDKHDDITFPIVNFPFNSSSLLPLVKITIDSSSISASPSYGVYISQLMRYSWACAQYIDFLDRYQLLTQKLLKQKFYCRHHNHRYEISISQMTIDHLLFT
jgi:hypothetical protein